MQFPGYNFLQDTMHRTGWLTNLVEDQHLRGLATVKIQPCTRQGGSRFLLRTMRPTGCSGNRCSGHTLVTSSGSKSNLSSSAGSIVCSTTQHSHSPQASHAAISRNYNGAKRVLSSPRNAHVPAQELHATLQGQHAWSHQACKRCSVSKRAVLSKQQQKRVAGAACG